MSSINDEIDGAIEDTVSKDEKKESISVDKKLAEAITKIAEEEDMNVNEVLEDVFGDGFYVGWHDIEESVVKLKYIDPWSSSDKQIDVRGEEGETSNTIKVYRRLRDEFPPVTAGVEYTKSFTAGGGFDVDIQDPNDEKQQEAKRVINELNRNIYQDEVTKGLDSILDILLDEVFTVGCAGAEIVYEKFEKEPPDLSKYLRQATDEELKNGSPLYISSDLDGDEWKELGGIVQLKIVDDGVKRLLPKINKTTYKIEYWTVDEEETKKYNEKNKDEPKEISILLPWQVLWLSWDRRGSNLKGNSLIKPVARTSLMLEDILSSIGLSLKKWSDKKYFFILGSDKTGRSWAPPKVTGFLRDVKRMTTEGGTGVAVPAGFDIKEIGGEIYEGTTIIDNLISLICAGMRVPRTFFEQGKTQEGDKAWLAWIVTYATNQKLLRRAIEHQFWARHLYCINGGTTVRVSKQGKRLESQDIVPVYVPKMSWKSEGKWHIQQKIEELSKILNVANPVSPELKLEVESDIANTLGYSELSLENARRVLKIQQEVKLLDSEIDKIKSEVLMKVYEKAKDDEEFLKSIMPIIQGTTKKEQEPVENPNRPPPVPLKRLVGGVSRTTNKTEEKDTTQYGEENMDVNKNVNKDKNKDKDKKEKVEETIQFDSYEDFLMTSIKMREHESRTTLYSKMLDILDKMG